MWGKACGVVAAENDFDALKAEGAPGFGPASVVADHHAEDGFRVGGEVWDAEGVEAEVAGFEVAFFELDVLVVMGWKDGWKNGALLRLTWLTASGSLKGSKSPGRWILRYLERMEPLLAW